MTKPADTQPSYDDLLRAWNEAIVCADIGGSRAETMQELIALRERKTTWFGKEENDLRLALDAYLRDRGYQPANCLRDGDHDEHL